MIELKTTTFLESPGRQLSYGISGYLLKQGQKLVLSDALAVQSQGLRV